MVPNSAHGIAVAKAAELLGFVNQLPGKSFCEQPSGKAIVTINIKVAPVGKDALSRGDPQYTPLFPSACHMIDPDTGAKAHAKCFCHRCFVCHGLHSKSGNGGNQWSVDEKTMKILVSSCLKQGRCLECHRNQKRSQKGTLVENILNHEF